MTAGTASAGKYSLEAKGLIYLSPPAKDKEGNEVEQSPMWLCSPLSVVSLAKDKEDRWGKLIEFLDPDKQKVSWVMPAKLLAKKDELWQALLDRGVSLASSAKARDLLHHYLNREQPEKRARVVSRFGWHEQDGQTAFVLPDQVYGNTNDIEIIAQNQQQNPYGIKGTVDSWVENIGKPCVGNSRLVVAVSTSYASSLLMIVGEESGGLHFKGNSRDGKTTGGIVAMSVGGNPHVLMIRWRATSNGLEAICEERCDGLLFLDEMGQVDAKDAGEIAYMIANGKGKQRAKSDANARVSKDWRLLFISSGEISLADKMTEIGRRTRAGQEVRLLNIPANAGAGMGMFENLHGAASPGEFAEQLRRATQDTYGAPLRVFLDHIARAYADDPENIKSALRESRDSFIRDHLPAGASGQVRSACGRFGMIAAAGEIATEFGLTGWPKGEAIRAAVTCFRAWLDERGTIGDHDLEKGIQQVLSFVERHGNSRFEDVNVEGFNTHNRAGYRRTEQTTSEGWRREYYVLPLAWREELCKGYDHKTIEAEMLKRGLLSGQSGRPQAVVHCGHDGYKRVYRLRLVSEDDRTPAQRRADVVANMMRDDDEQLANGVTSHFTAEQPVETTTTTSRQPFLN